MDVLAETYKLAFIKKAGLGRLVGLAGKGLAAMPFWIAGAVGASVAFKKKPKVERMAVPQRDYDMLLKEQQRMRGAR